ncbi:MAG: ATP-binding cassette domain-containing protein [Thermoanaerobacteraceae bacterium]|nr:ATP-binding cassette domain-containing protein [Thermoanaerobacteraceae bacterium]
MIAVEARDLTKIYPGGVYGLRDVNVKIEEGEMVGILGASGAGKTTLFRLINGALYPTRGCLKVLGRTMSEISLNALRELRRKLAVIYQRHNVVPSLPVVYNVLMGSSDSLSLAQTVRLFFYLREEEREEVSAILRELGIEDKMYTRAEELSGGQQQRVAVARAIISKPQLVLADEPIASVDSGTAIKVMETLRRLNSERGATILVSLHQVDCALRYCSRLLVFSHGRLIYDGDPGGVRAIDLYQEDLSHVQC